MELTDNGSERRGGTVGIGRKYLSFYGIGAYTEVLVRVSHFVVPIALWLLIFGRKALIAKR